MKEIREYIKANIRKADAALIEHDGSTSVEQLPATKINSLYMVSFGEFSTVQDNYFRDTVPVEIRLYKNSSKASGMSFDKCVELAKSIRSKLVSPLNVAQSASIGSIKANNFQVSEYASNLDVLEIKLSLTVEVSNPL